MSELGIFLDTYYFILKVTEKPTLRTLAERPKISNHRTVALELKINGKDDQICSVQEYSRVKEGLQNAHETIKILYILDKPGLYLLWV